MTAVRFTGRSAIIARVIGCLLLSAVVGAVQAAEAPQPTPVEVKLIPPAAEAPYQVIRETQQQVRWLDPTIFTEISPLSVPDVALKLPADQEE